VNKDIQCTDNDESQSLMDSIAGYAYFVVLKSAVANEGTMTDIILNFEEKMAFK